MEKIISMVAADSETLTDFATWKKRHGLKAHDVVTKAMRKIDPDFTGGVMVLAINADQIETKPEQKAIMIGVLVLGDWSETDANTILLKLVEIAPDVKSEHH